MKLPQSSCDISRPTKQGGHVHHHLPYAVFIHPTAHKMKRRTWTWAPAPGACFSIQTYFFIPLCWFPAHLIGVIKGSLLNFNESAHEAARDLTLRSAPRHGVTVLTENRDSPSTYNEVTKYYLFNRRIYGLAHPKLNRAQALTLRLLQTGTYPCPRSLTCFILRHIYGALLQGLW